jgi:hypothetical protein
MLQNNDEYERPRDPKMYIGMKIVELADVSNELACHDQACDLIDLAYRAFDQWISGE